MDLRRRQRRGAVVAVLAALLAAGVAYAVVSSLNGSSREPNLGGSGSRSPQTPAVASGAPAWLGIDTVSFPVGGVVIADVVPGSPAAAAGLQPGDVITQIGNRTISTPTDVGSALAGMHAGDQVEIQYDEGPLSETTQVTLASQPPGHP